MIQDNQPKVPNLPPLIANGDANRGYYVCTYKNKWDSEKKRSVRFGLIEFYDEFVKQYPGLKRFQVYRTDGPQRLVFIPKPPRRKRIKDEIPVPQARSNEIAARAARDIPTVSDIFDDESFE